MKKIYFLLVSLFFALGLQAQVEKTIENTAGHLDSLLSTEELTSIIHLTITGTMNVRDFRTIRDDMPVLEVLDIRDVTIYDSGYNYPANEIPASAFYDKVSLKTFHFPLSCTSIGSSAFNGCTGLTGELQIPSTIKFIDNGAYAQCTGLTGHLIIPPLVTEIESNVFWGCSGFTSLTIPPSVKAIKFNAFNGCSGLQTIDVQSLTPVPLSFDQMQFNKVDMATCILKVPYGTKDLYASASVWNAFTHIVEQEQGFLLSETSLRFDTENSTDGSISMKANVDWNAVSDQQWLSVSPASGDGDQNISISVKANTTIDARQGTITFSSEGFDSQLIRVTQNGIPMTVSITPGGLDGAFTAEEKAVLSQLILTGSMNARDFNTIRYQMPMLEVLDISGATIEAYTDTTYGNHINHEANTIPFAIHEWSDDFQTSHSLSEHPKLSIVKLPASLTAIGYRAFYNCKNLTTVEMQSAVEYIGEEAFYYCSSLTSINLSATVNHIGDKAFHFCSSLTSLELPSALTVINYFTFADCTSLRSVKIPESVTEIKDHAFYGCAELQTVVMSPYVTHIQFGAFKDCGSLTSVTIPKSVTYISSQAFLGCKNLQSIYAYSEQPVVIGAKEISSVFDYVDKSRCIVYVPYGTKELYANQYGWKDFLNIVEMTAFELSSSELLMEAAQGSQSIMITSEGEWSTACDRKWLSFSPASGDSSQTITITCQENTASEPRTATVTFSDANGYSQSITVNQRGNVNSIPAANAGADQSVEEGTLVQLDGSASTDADGNALIYQWTAPDGITLSSASDDKPTFTAPKVEKDTIYTFKLVVNDGKENSVSDKVLITITNKIIELGVSAKTVVFESRESSAKIRITGNARWTAISDKEWLTLSLSSGEGQKEITLSAPANDTPADRVATVMVSAPGAEARTITVTQHALVTGLDEIISVIEIKFYPNPFTSEMTIAVTNPSLKEVTVEIFSMSGLKIRTLAKAQKGANISLSWNGTHEQGQKVPDGVYLLKVNGQTRKVVKK